MGKPLDETIIGAKFALANWQKYRADRTDEVVCQANKLESALAELIAALDDTPAFPSEEQVANAFHRQSFVKHQSWDQIVPLGRAVFEDRAREWLRVYADVIDTEGVLPQREAVLRYPSTSLGEQQHLIGDTFSGFQMLRDEASGLTTPAPAEPTPVGDVVSIDEIVAVLERCRDREHNPFEPDNQTTLHGDLCAILSRLEGDPT